jgi:hypothetical protein
VQLLQTRPSTPADSFGPSSHGTSTMYRLAVCDLSLINWDQVQIIFNHSCVLRSEQLSTF